MSRRSFQNSRTLDTIFGSTKLARSLAQKSLLIALTLMVGVLPICAQEEGCVDPASKLGEPANQPNTTGPSSIEPPDYYVTAETALDQRAFEHPSFNIRSIIKSSMLYYKAGDEANKKTYETIWYHDGKPLGMDRASGLDIPADKKVAIKILQSPCASYDEHKASANLILRMVLDVRLNRDTISVVEVPSSSFQLILQELQTRKAKVLPPGEEAVPDNTKVKFKLQSSSTGLAQVVYFT